MKPSHFCTKGFRDQGEVLINIIAIMIIIFILSLHNYEETFILYSFDFSPFVPGVLKCVLLCDIFTKHKSDLSREERQEIIQHCRKRCEIQQS